MTFEERIAAFNETPIPSIAGSHIVIWLDENGFFTAPASTKYHGAYEGGLFDHSLAVTNTLVDLTVKNQLKWGRPESPYLIGIRILLFWLTDIYFLIQRSGSTIRALCSKVTVTSQLYWHPHS